MSTRVKHTLMAAVRGIAATLVLTAWWLARGSSPSGVFPWAAGFLVFFAALTCYTWWWYGDSEKAVALRAKANAKKASRQPR